MNNGVFNGMLADQYNKSPHDRYSFALDTEHRDLYERYKAGDESTLEEARQMVREAAAKVFYIRFTVREGKRKSRRRSYCHC